MQNKGDVPERVVITGNGKVFKYVSISHLRLLFVGLDFFIIKLLDLEEDSVGVLFSISINYIKQ